MKNTGSAKLMVYGIMIPVAGLFLFPFYWAISSSLKSPKALKETPLSFYPSEVRTESVSLDTAGRLVEAQGQKWFLLCSSVDSRPGGFFVRLKDSEPTAFVEWLADGTYKPAPDAGGPLRFKDLELVAVKGEAKPMAKMARMVRPQNGTAQEWLFLVSSGSTEVRMLRNPEYKPIRRFSARWSNYSEALKGPDATIGSESGHGFFRFMRNSLFISLMAVLGQILSSSIVAFGFSRLQFKGRDMLFVILLATLMIPAQVTMIPMFAIFKSLGWVDTFLPLIVPHFTASAFNVFLLRQYMLTIPPDLDEAAAMDGCGHFGTYARIIMPNCLPAIILVTLFTFIGSWEDVMGPLIYLDNPAYRTVTLGLEYFRSPYVDNSHLLMSGAVLAMLPIMCLFIFLQRHIMAGIATTGLKG